jgi:long-chain acyl-CoA synthetase
LIQKANAGLESHQRIRSWSQWPESDFPRTPSTGKVKRNQVARAVNQASGDQPEPQSSDSGLSPLQSILSQFTSVDPAEISDEHSLSHDLGLSSLDRVELLTALEEDMGLDLDEDALATVTTFGDLKAVTKSKGLKKPGPSHTKTGIPERPGREAEIRPEPAEQPVQEPPAQAGSEPKQLPRLELPTWSRRLPSRPIRFLFQETLLIPASRLYLRLSVSGLDNLEQLRPPIMFAANHASHLDTLAILAALPSSWRRRVAPAMLQEYFTPLLEPESFGLHRRILSRTIYILLCHLLQAYPLPQKTGGIRQAIRFTGELAEYGNCPLIFPEGERTQDGRMGRFQPGVGMMARWLDLPVVPVCIEGLFELLSIHHSWPRPGKARLEFGEPLIPSPDVDPATFTTRLQERVRALGSER